MKIVFSLLSVIMVVTFYAQYDIKFEVRIDNESIAYTSLIGDKASKTFFKMEGIDMILLNIANEGAYSLMSEELIAIKVRQEMIDTLEMCNCTFVKTGSKKTILGYNCDEYIQKMY